MPFRSLGQLGDKVENHVLEAMLSRNVHFPSVRAGTRLRTGVWLGAADTFLKKFRAQIPGCCSLGTSQLLKLKLRGGPLAAPLGAVFLVAGPRFGDDSPANPFSKTGSSLGFR